MRKICALFAALLMLLTLTACELTFTFPTTAPDGPTTTITEPTVMPTEPTTLPTESIDPDSYEALAALGINLTAFDYDLNTYIVTLVLTWTNNTETAAMLTDYFDIYLTQDDIQLNDCSVVDAPIEPNETVPTVFQFEMKSENLILVHIAPKNGDEIVLEFNVNAVG